MTAQPKFPRRNPYPRLRGIIRRPVREPARRVRVRELPRPILGPPQRVPVPDNTPSQEQNHREAKRRGQLTHPNRHAPGAHNQVRPAAKKSLEF